MLKRIIANIQVLIRVERQRGKTVDDMRKLNEALRNLEQYLKTEKEKQDANQIK